MSLVNYVLFVTFFPHLVAGPILHIREMAPQILSAATYRLRASNVSTGFSYFILGLSKKVLLADPLAQLVNTGFNAPGHLQLVGSWFTVLSYSLQLYFDFSGYSDMAIGLAYMFGPKFPLNFNSPYRARSIIEFWQRWHMTLTRYLTLLLFNPVTLWMTRRRAAAGRTTRGRNMSLRDFAGVVILPTVYTMFLAGIWHGAGLQFIVFGLLHAVYLSVNHAWRNYGPQAPSNPRPALVRGLIVAGQVALTYGCVVVAQVFFRASSVHDAVSVLSAMAGAHGVDATFVPRSLVSHLGGLGRALVKHGWLTSVVHQGDIPRQPAGLLLRYLIIFILPNTQQIMGRFEPYLAKVEPTRWKVLIWRPQAIWAVCMSAVLFVDLLSMNYSPPFLYFQF
jgi:D-alanyl-lipoteichoic acid acyltransferase DltB (MBOAT superfamily)